jgi:hypothetical protein
MLAKCIVASDTEKPKTFVLVWPRLEAGQSCNHTAALSAADSWPALSGVARLHIHHRRIVARLGSR